MALIPIYWWNKEVHSFKISQDSFCKQPWANGVILLGCVAIAMLLANLPFTKDIYHNFLHTEFTMHIASPDGLVDWVFPKDMTMEKFINDILMVIFFFTVGLEIKREMVCGELSSFKKAILPVIAAFGGVVMPALIYTVVNHGTLASSGWGIPTATDIAFAVGILSILGDRVPVSLKVFLTALAIADDLIAILVVALFYGGTIKLPLLGIALVVILFVAMMKHLGEKRIGFYMIPAILVWFLFYYSGIHATMTGVVMALLIPMEARYNKAKFHRRAKILYDGLIEAEQLPQRSGAPSPAPPEQPHQEDHPAVLPAGAQAQSHRELCHHAHLRPGQRRRGDYGPVLFQRVQGHRPGAGQRGAGYLPGPAAGQAAGYHPGLLAGHQVQGGRHAFQGQLAHALCRGLPGRYRLYHEHLRGYAFLRRGGD